MPAAGHTAGPLDKLLTGIETTVTALLKAGQSIATDAVPLVQSGQRLAEILHGNPETGGKADVRAADGERKGDDLLSRLLQFKLEAIPVQTDVGVSSSAFMAIGLAGLFGLAAILLARR